MNNYMGGIEINSGKGTRGSGVPGRITLPNWWTGGSQYNQYYFAHELAHIWDANTGHVGMIGIVDGVADYLNEYINGDNSVLGTSACRFCDESGYDHIPKDYRFATGVMTDPKGRPYGNNSTADYLAESFALNIYYSGDEHVLSDVTLWVKSVISIQASHLP